MVAVETDVNGLEVILQLRKEISVVAWLWQVTGIRADCSACGLITVHMLQRVSITITLPGQQPRFD